MNKVNIKWINENSEIINIIDVRTPAEFENKNIKNSINIPLKELLEKHNSLINKKDIYYVICYSGSRSKFAVEELKKEGYKNLINVEEGVSSL